MADDDKRPRDPRLVLRDDVWDTPGRVDIKAVAGALFRYMSDDLTTTTSVPRLAHLAGLDEKTTRARLAALVAAGGVTRRDRSTARGTTSPEWRAVPERLCAAIVEVSAQRAKRVPPVPRTAPGPVDGTGSLARDLPGTVDGTAGPSVDGTGAGPVDGPRSGDLIRGSDPGIRSGDLSGSHDPEPPPPGEGPPMSTSAEVAASLPTREPTDRVVMAGADIPLTTPAPSPRTDTHPGVDSGQASVSSADGTVRDEAVVAHPPAASSSTRKAKPPKAKPPTDTPFRRRVSDAFGEAFREVFGTRYPWVFKGYPSDAQRVTVWIDAAKVREATPDEGVARLHGAALAYCRAVKAGAVWPHDEPASTTRFTKDLARWLQTNPATPPKATGKAAPKLSPLAVFMEWTDADETDDADCDVDAPREPLPERARDSGGPGVMPAALGDRAR